MDFVTSTESTYKNEKIIDHFYETPLLKLVGMVSRMVSAKQIENVLNENSILGNIYKK